MKATFIALMLTLAFTALAISGYINEEPDLTWEQMAAEKVSQSTTNPLLDSENLKEYGLCFEFRSECVCDRYDLSDYDNERFALVYYRQYVFEYEELIVDKALYDEWCQAAADNRIFRVFIEWDKKGHHFHMIPDTYITWECDQPIIYPEM